MSGGRRFLALLTSGALLLGACGGDDGSEPERATVPTAESTTSSTAAATTTVPSADFEALPIDPALTPEQQVEAAYLHSWEIYLDAVGNGRTEYLPLAFAERGLEIVEGDVEKFVGAGHRAVGAPEHDIRGVIVDGAEAVVVDAYTNHLTLIDAETREPIEPDPNEVVLFEFRLELIESSWLVVGIAS